MVYPRIGIIDSGLSLNINGMDYSKISYIDNDANIDIIGHGTKIAYIINTICPNAELKIIKIFKEKLVTTTGSVLRALQKCEREGIDIICLSTSITNFNNYKIIEDVCTKIIKNNVIIISSAHNFKIPCLPAYIDGVYGVGISYTPKMDDMFFCPNDDIQLYAKGLEVTVPSKKGKFIKVNGTSYATAVAVGNIANIVSEFGMENLDKYMRKYFMNKNAKIMKCENFDFISCKGGNNVY